MGDGHQLFSSSKIDAAILGGRDALILGQVGALGADFKPCLDGLGCKIVQIVRPGSPKLGGSAQKMAQGPQHLIVLRKNDTGTPIMTTNGGPK